MMGECQPQHDLSFPQLLAEEVCRHFSLKNSREGEWVVTPGLRLALHPDRSCMAISYKNEVAVFVLQPGDALGPLDSLTPQHSVGLPQDGAAKLTAAERQAGDTKPSLPYRLSSASGHSHMSRASSMSRHQPRHGSLLGCSTTGDADVTCISWVQLPHTTSTDVPPATAANPQAPTQGRRSTGAESGGSDVRCAAGGDVVLVVCDSHGHLSLHEEQGRAMFRQRLHTGPLTHLCARTGVTRPDSRDAHDELTITGSGCLFQLSLQQLSTTWAACEAAESRAAKKQRQGVISSVLTWGEASIIEQVPAMPHQRWDLPRQLRHHSLAVCIGSLPPDVYNILRNPFQLQSNTGAANNTRSVIMCGAAPCLALLELRLDKTSRSTLGAALGAGIGLASDIISVARHASTGVVQGPAAITRGIKNFIMAPLMLSPPRPGRGAAPLVTHPDPQGGVTSTQPTPTVRAELHDHPRRVTWLSRAPRGPYVVSADSLGRVLLVDSSSLMMVRMWKGYRDAQCGWIELPAACLSPAPAPDTHIPDPTHQPRLTPQSHHVQVWGGPAAQPQDSCKVVDQGDIDTAGHVDGPGAASQDGESEGYASMHVEPVAHEGDEQGDASRQGLRHGLHRQQLARRLTGSATCATELVLVVYAPRRQVVEFWSAPHGPCLLSLPVNSYCQLIHVPGMSPPWSDVLSDDGVVAEETGASSCLLLDGVTGQVQDLAMVAEAMLRGWA